jgi:aminoglycoside 3-N-acetyltransferase
MKTPSTAVGRGRLVEDLLALGVIAGQTLLTHVSLNSIGWVEGGASTVIAALLEAVGVSGNIVMLTATEENSLTSRTHHAVINGLPPDVMQKYLAQMRPFDARTTPCTTGAVAEALRTTAGAVRSVHPQSSFTAIGPDAEALMADHSLDCHHGMDSPLGKLYRFSDKARVLMIGVDYKVCTAIHLAEYRYRPDPPKRRYDCVIERPGKWITYEDVVLDDSRFDSIGEFIQTRVFQQSGRVGQAVSRLVPLCDIVDSAAEWMRVHRG